MIGVVTDDTTMLRGVVEAQRERAKTMKEMASSSRFFFEEPVVDQKAVAKNLTPEALVLLG